MACAFHTTQGKCIYSRFIPSRCAPCNVLEGWCITLILMSHVAVDMAPGMVLAPPQIWCNGNKLALFYACTTWCQLPVTLPRLYSLFQKLRGSGEIQNVQFLPQQSARLLVKEPDLAVEFSALVLIFCRCLTWLQPVVALWIFMSFSQRLGIFRLCVGPYHPTLTKAVKYFIEVFSF